jgi:hypothetical protein
VAEEDQQLHGSVKKGKSSNLHPNVPSDTGASLVIWTLESRAHTTRAAFAELGSPANDLIPTSKRTLVLFLELRALPSFLNI